MTQKADSAPGGVEVDLVLTYYLPDVGIRIEEGLLTIEDVRRVGQVADGLESMARALRAIRTGS